MGMECHNCNKSLAGQRYVTRGEDDADKQNYCVKCHDELFANTCATCQAKIGVGQKDLTFNNEHFHEACFVCSDKSCSKSLISDQFEVLHGKRYCVKCYDVLASKDAKDVCPGCKQVFHSGGRRMEFRGQRWHEHCFKCSTCDEAIGQRSFYPKDDGFVCDKCHQDKYAKRCGLCAEVISGHGVTYNDTPYHRECFSCAGCTETLAGKSFMKHKNQNYCQDCFTSKFAKMCEACSNKINAGVRYLEFEQRFFHNECFSCAKCGKKLADESFTTSGQRFVCRGCA